MEWTKHLCRSGTPPCLCSTCVHDSRDCCMRVMDTCPIRECDKYEPEDGDHHA